MEPEVRLLTFGSRSLIFFLYGASGEGPEVRVLTFALLALNHQLGVVSPKQLEEPHLL